MTSINLETYPVTTYPFLSGGGEMGELIRTKDWSANSIGTPDHWPSSLRITVQILLNCKFPMFLWWGPELICFYNDAYRPSLGENGKHPGILGMPANEAWPEIWDIIKPLIDQVLAGGEATWSEDQLIPIYRNGKLEDVYWTFSYSPVNDESGLVTGVLVTCHETTDKVLTRKKLEESKDQLQFAIDAADLATWDINPAANSFTGSERLKEWHGLQPGDEFDLETGFNTVIEQDRDNLKKAIAASLEFSSGGVLDIEYTIVNAGTKQSRIVRAKGKATFGEDKIAIRLNGTLQDITEQATYRKQVEESEQRFRNIIKQAPLGITILNGPDFMVEMANETYLQFIDKQEADFINKPLFESLPEVKERVEPVLCEILKTGTPYYGYEFPITIRRYHKKEIAYFNFVYHPLKESDGSISRIIVVATDVTPTVEAKKTIEQSEQRTRSLIDSAPFPIGVYIGKEMRIEMVNQSILTVWGKGNDVVGKLYADVLPELAGQGIYEQLDNVYTTGIPFHAHNQRVDIMINGKLISHYFNYSFTPLFDNTGNVYGVMNTAAEVTDLVLAKEKIEESEKEFRQLADSLPELVWTTDQNGVQAFASRRWEEYTGVNPYNADTFKQTVHPDDIDNVLKVWGESVASGKIYKTQLRLKSKNGIYQWFYVHGEPILNEEGKIEKWVGAFTNFNEQKKAEEELINAIEKIEESEKRFRNVANSAPVFIWMAGTDRLRNFFNTAWLNFRGRTMEQEKGNGWVEGVHPDDLEKCLDAYKKAFEKQEEYHMEYRLKRYDGEYRWISARGVPRFTSNGALEGFIGACMDIHERVIFHKKLKEDEERLNIIIAASELGTWELNLVTKAVIYSNRYLEILGHPHQTELTHAQIIKQLHPDDIPIREDAFEQAYITGILHFESRVIWPDHSIHWVEVRGKVFYDEFNKPLRLVGTVRDITEEKHYQQKLEQREQKFRLLADSMPQFVWTGDAEGNLNYFSKAGEDFSGLTAAQLETDGWLQIVHPDDREENIKAWRYAITTGTDFIFEHRFERWDGEYRWQLSRAIPQKDAAGNIQMWVGTSTDIQEMKEQDQQKDYFISMASHELKTPITSIKGYVQILQSTYQKSEDPFLKNSLKIIDKQIVTLTSLISDLLDLSKIKSGNLYLNKENFEVAELIQEVINEITHINPGYSISFLKQKSATLYADKGRIAQVLINLLTNAVKYSPNSRKVTVENYIDGNLLTVTVEDTGIGISKNDQEKIFERFYRVEGKNEKTFPGFGIGLFISAEIIKRHNGTIGVSSDPGKGSIFYFSIPLTT